MKIEKEIVSVLACHKFRGVSFCNKRAWIPGLVEQVQVLVLCFEGLLLSLPSLPEAPTIPALL